MIRKFILWRTDPRPAHTGNPDSLGYPARNTISKLRDLKPRENPDRPLQLVPDESPLWNLYDPADRID
jgi:hypothetical protein